MAEKNDSRIAAKASRTGILDYSFLGKQLLRQAEVITVCDIRRLIETYLSSSSIVFESWQQSIMPSNSGADR
jgi:hypothetical protein